MPAAIATRLYVFAAVENLVLRVRSALRVSPERSQRKPPPMDCQQIMSRYAEKLAGAAPGKLWAPVFHFVEDQQRAVFVHMSRRPWQEPGCGMHIPTFK